MCKNTIGSYECLCKEGYKKENNECVIDLSGKYILAYPVPVASTFALTNLCSAPRPKPIFFGLYADQLLRYCAIAGLLVALSVIIMRRSIGLTVLFLFTLTIVMYIESEGVTRWLRNMTAPFNVSRTEF